MFCCSSATRMLLSAYVERRPSMKSARLYRLLAAGARRAAELSGVGIAAVERVDVLHFGQHALEFIAGLERVPALQPCVVDLRIEHRRVLPLRVGRLSAEIRVAGDQLRRQARGHARIGRQAGDAVDVFGAAFAVVERERILSCLRGRPAEARFEQRRPRRHIRQSARELLVRDVGLGVAGAAGRSRDRRLIEDVGVAPADAAEQRQGRADLDVDLAAGLRRAVGELLEDLQVVRRRRVGRLRQIVQHLARERAHRDRRARRIDLTGQADCARRRSARPIAAPASGSSSSSSGCASDRRPRCRRRRTPCSS